MSELPDTPPANQRVTVSVETLRTEIRLATAELEIRLTDKLASKSAVDQLANDHSRLAQRVDTIQATVARREPLAEKFEREWDTVKEDVEGLKINKAEDIAVKNFRRYILGGGALTAVFMLLQAGIAIYALAHG